MKDAPLDMRMDKTREMSAMTVVNEYDYARLVAIDFTVLFKNLFCYPVFERVERDEYDYARLVDIFFRYGEERYSREIAKGILRNRPIETTLGLVEVIKTNVPTKYYLT